MRRTATMLLATAALFLSLLVQAAPAAAAIEWCAEDPVITVNGTALHITTTMATAALNVREVAYLVTVPQGSTVTVDNPQGPGLIPATVEIRYGGQGVVRTRVTVSSALAFTVVVNVTGGERTVSKSGVSNKAIRLTTELLDDYTSD